MTTRTCGQCKACCTVFGVEEVGKPYYRPCPHLTEAGCGIYKERPESCRGFSCLWLSGLVPGDERRRPDNLGVVFTLKLRDTPTGQRTDLEVWEVVEEAAENERVRYLAHRIWDQLPMLVLICRYPANISVPVRYPIDAGRWPDDVQYGNRHDPYRIEYQGGGMYLYPGDQVEAKEANGSCRPAMNDKESA